MAALDESLGNNEIPQPLCEREEFVRGGHRISITNEQQHRNVEFIDTIDLIEFVPLHAEADPGKPSAKPRDGGRCAGFACPPFRDALDIDHW